MTGVAARLTAVSAPGLPLAPLAPLGAAAPELPLLGRPLASWQAEEIRKCGLSLVEVAPGDPLPESCRVVFGADAVFTAATVKALLGEAKRADKPLRAAVPAPTPLYAFTAPLDETARPEGVPVPLWAAPGRGPALRRPADLGEAELAFVCDEDEAYEARVAPYGPPPHRLSIPRVRRLGGRFAHWLHVLNLNQAALETERRRLRARGRRSVRGRGVEIAPTAYCEGSILGEGVILEAQASVIDSWLGPGVKIAAHAVIERCVIGAGCHTLIDTHLRRVIALPGSTLSNIGITDVLLGERIFITTGVTFFGGRPGETIVVEGEDTGRPVLGGAVGPGAILGARALFDAGMAVPPGTVIVGRPDEAASGITDEKLAAAHMQRGRPDQDV